MRSLAQSLLDKFVAYLASHHWILHSNYTPGEFEADGNESVNIFDDNYHKKKTTKAGKESFILYPHELWALRHCAIEVGVPHEIIIPNLAVLAGVSNFVIEGPIKDLVPLEKLVKYSEDAMDYLYDRLQYRKTFSFDVVPGWKEGRISGTLAIGAFGMFGKTHLRQVFESTLRKYLYSMFEVGAMVDDKALDYVMRPITQFLYAPEINLIVRDLIDELCPWLDPAVLVE